MEIFLFAVFLIFSVAGIICHFFGLPGNWIIFAVSLLLAWSGDFDKIQANSIVVLLALAIGGEVLEFILGIIGAKKYESSNRAIAGSIVFGILGAIWGAPFFFGIGSVVGAFVGAFAGAVLIELLSGKGLDRSINSGWGTLLGRVGGSFTKIIIGIIMIVIVVTSFFSN